jgi:hypothetical protein
MCMGWCNASNPVQLLDKERRPGSLVSNMTYGDKGFWVSSEREELPITAS